MPKAKSDLTPEQQKRRKEVDERNRRMQERGVPFPHKTGGVFGGKPTERKR